MHRVKMMYYSCGANIVDLSNFNLLTTEGNLLPHRIIVVMVREDAMHGNYNRDPFNYQEIARYQKGGGLMNTKARQTGRLKRR